MHFVKEAVSCEINKLTTGNTDTWVGYFRFHLVVSQRAVCPSFLQFQIMVLFVDAAWLCLPKVAHLNNFVGLIYYFSNLCICSFSLVPYLWIAAHISEFSCNNMAVQYGYVQYVTRAVHFLCFCCISWSLISCVSCNYIILCHKMPLIA